MLMSKLLLREMAEGHLQGLRRKKGCLMGKRGVKGLTLGSGPCFLSKSPKGEEVDLVVQRRHSTLPRQTVWQTSFDQLVEYF